MTGQWHSEAMKDARDTREMTRVANAKRRKTIQDSNKVLANARQRSTMNLLESWSRKRRNPLPSVAEVQVKPEELQHDREASGRMVDEGGPVPQP